MRPSALFLFALAVGGCGRGVRATVLETPLVAGVPAPFRADRPLRWDFGDESPPQLGAEVMHAFARAGRFRVRGFDGDVLRAEVTVLVEPRAVFHAVPADADRVLAIRSLDELSAAVDFAERLLGGEATDRLLARWPAVGFAVGESSEAGPLDAREGAAVFTWPEEQLEVSLVGVVDDRGALAAFGAWLGEHGWSKAGEVEGVSRFESAEGNLDVFVDRGVLYAVAAPPTHREASVRARVAAMDARGLEADGPSAAALNELAAGGVVLFVRPPQGASWSLVTLAVQVLGDRAWVTGRALAKGPLWAAPKVEGRRLLSQAPVGPVAVASAALPARALLALCGLGKGTSGYEELARALAAEGIELEAALASFRGAFDAAIYFDVPGFVRGTLANGGRPQPAATVWLEAPITPSPALERLVAVWAPKLLEGAKRLGSEGAVRWRGTFWGRPVEAVLSQEALTVKGGAPVDERETVSLSDELKRRFEGAFGPGHVSLFVDIGQLRRELLTPRLMSDVDLRSALTAQALAATFLDHLTQLDSLMLDAAADPRGAVLQAVLTLRPRSPPPGADRTKDGR